MIEIGGGIEIGYDDVGTGLPIVFIHGFPHDRTLWSAQLGALAVPTRTLACDLRGCGESTGTASSMDEYAGDVARWMRALNLDRAVVAGLSMGGYVAFALWRRHPELFRALVLAHTRATADTADARAKRNEQIAYVTTHGSAALANQLLPGMLGKTTREERPEITERVHAMLARARPAATIGALTALRDRPDSTPTLATISVPALIVAGDEDVLTPVADARAMHAGIARSRIEVIAGAGHLSNVERPASFNHVLSEFLATLAYT